MKVCVRYKGGADDLVIQNDESLRWADAEIFYVPAIIDYAFLEKHVIDAETHRLVYSVRWSVYDDNGGVRDVIEDAIPFPDALHALQASLAFFEKALKYLLCINGAYTAQELRSTGHDLVELVRLVNQAVPNFINGMNPELIACLDEMKKIDYTILRYLDRQAPEFEVRFLDLKELLRYVFKFLKQTRWEKTHADPAKRNCIGAFRNTITVSIEEYRQPLQSILKDSFERVLQHQDLSEEEKRLIGACYRYDGDVGRYLMLDGVDDNTRAALFRVFEKARFVFPDFGRLKIKIKH